MVLAAAARLCTSLNGPAVLQNACPIRPCLLVRATFTDFFEIKDCFQDKQSEMRTLTARLGLTLPTLAWLGSTRGQPDDQRNASGVSFLAAMAARNFMFWVSFMNSDPKFVLGNLEKIAEYEQGGTAHSQSLRYLNLVAMLAQRHELDASSIATQHPEIRRALLADCQLAMA